MQPNADGHLDLTTSPVGAHRRLRGWMPAGLAGLLAAVTFAVTIGGTYIYDDLHFARDDERYEHPDRWHRFLTEGLYVGGMDNAYRPLTSLSFAVPIWLHGHRPAAHHAANVLLHAAAAAAVAEFARRLYGARVALAAGALFAVHPVHVESVAWLVGRADVLCTLATFGGLCLFLGRPLNGRRVAGIVGCFFVAVLSKDQGILFPLLLLLLGVLTRRSRPLDAAGRQSAKWLAITLIWTLSAYLVYRESILPFAWDRSRMHWVFNPLVRSVGIDRLLVPIAIFGRALGLLFFPAHLSIEYGADVIGWTARFREPYLYLGLAGIAAWTAAIVVALRRAAGTAVFCLLGFGLTYGMVSNFPILIPTIFGERLLYMPSAFFLILLAAAAARLRLPRAAMTAVVALLVLAGAGRAIAYARIWNDKVSFYEKSLAAQPKSVRLHQLTFDEYVKQGDWPRARQIAEAATAQIPDAFDGPLMLGKAALAQDDLPGASKALDLAWARNGGEFTRSLSEEIAERQKRRASTLPTGPATRPWRD